MNSAEYIQYDGLGLAELIKRKEISPQELLEVAHTRALEVQSKLNCLTSWYLEEARSRAKDIDTSSLFAGVPFLIKDLACHVKGIPTTNGSQAFAGYVPDFDSEIVKRFRAAGLVDFAKTNTPEMGLTITTESRLHGPCLNPWDLSKTAGGSSGGSAAAVAAGVVPLAHGGDGGGSIRVPASCCNLFGLKASRGLLPMGPDVAEGWSGMVSQGVLSRSVRDTAAILDACAGMELGAPYASPVVNESFLGSLQKPPPKCRIAYYFAPATEETVDSEVRLALESTVKLCESLGHEMVAMPPRFDGKGFSKAFNVIMAANTLSELKGGMQLSGQCGDPEQAEKRLLETNMLESLTQTIAKLAKGYSAEHYVDALYVMHRVGREVAQFMTEENIDFLLSPVLARPPFELGFLNTQADKIEEYFQKLGTIAIYTHLFNMTGQPAMSVPLYWSSNGLPIGSQFAAPFGNDQQLLQLAYQLEQAQPWGNRIALL